YARDPYRTRFALDYIGQPSLAVGADSYGTYIAGGASLFWSDMLGNHNLATALQLQGSFKDVAALVGYTNLTRRLNWAISAQQIPYLYAFCSQGFFGCAYIDPNVGVVEDITIYRQYNRSVGGAVAYPLSRVQRIEASAGLLNVSWDIERKIRYLSLGEDETIDLEAPDAITLAQSSVALVYDNSLWGVASPLLGQRYRLEIGANVGTLDFFNAVADYRKYVMPVRPLTIAARLLHFGRYGRDAEDSDRLQPLFLGYDGFVRGYEYGSFDFVEECNADGSCPNYTNLFGSKMLIGNLEVRFPPLGLLGIGSGLFGFLPIEMVLFGDAGIAWWEGHDVSDPAQRDLLRPFFLGGERRPVYSAGAGLRMNVFGFMIIELDYVYPFSRERGGHLQFSFIPGF
ncbi:MAG: BamA/TamA family outer membrane protein, partial [Gemmatimonadales bacterium]|nr:BamA/TamA family outer membrane protein [Gemmatimonadales bacterium]